MKENINQETLHASTTCSKDYKTQNTKLEEVPLYFCSEDYTYIHTLHYITLHGSKVSQMTVGCGISHTITKTHTVQLKHSIRTYTHININQILSTYTMYTNL
jgi:hypothetical protein